MTWQPEIDQIRRREIEASPDPAGIEEIIDPHDARPLLREWVEGAYRMLAAEPGPKARACRL
jgi:hypothetical protein